MSQFADALHQRTLALAAMLQAARMVDRLARKGTCDAEDFAIFVKAIFAPAEQRVERVYGDARHLRVGLRLLHDLLAGQQLERGQDILRMSATLMTLEKRLSRNANMLGKLADGLARIRRQAEYFHDTTHETVIANLADLYGETLSTMKPRVIVHGKQVYLRQSEHTRRIRTLLLSAIRAAHLWRKHGGSHFTLLLRRRALLRAADALLALTADDQSSSP
ncbi:MAG: lysogenization regulator HflD [Zetaproteobacteria bacterium]|nr:MAG: lysogenization regulator HflD [Zetaproteobacteria bacterium]